MSTHSDRHYIKIWAVLVGLLVVSVVGPMLEVKLITLVAAFGIAGVKAYLVAKHFMHINDERGFIAQLVILSVALIVLLFIFVAPDVLRHDGQNWSNDAAKASVKAGLEAGASAH